MSRLKIEVKELLDLAKLTNDESDFQQNHHYRKFKDKYKLDIEICVVTLMMGLKEIKFFNESVFWCQKILENSRVGDKDFKLLALSIITESFYCLEKYEKSIEYGKKAIEYQKGLLEHDLIRNNSLTTILDRMIWALKKLDKKEEAMKYVRELLKVSVELYNASEVFEKDFEKRMLLVSYLCLIDLQVQLGESKLAKKSFKKHFELFNLNSTNPNDVLLALKEEGYENILPLANSTKTKTLPTKFSKKFIDSQEFMNYWVKKVYLFHQVGQMCWKKHIVFFGCTSNQTWSNLSLDVCFDILKHIKVIIENKEKYRYFIFDLLNVNPIVGDAISMTLLLADRNHLKRENLFSNLFLLIRSLIADPNMKNISYYVAEAQRENDKINLQKVMPFIQFCLKSLDKEGASYNENIDLKLKFVMLKNNLIVMNHFKTNGREKVMPQKAGEKDSLPQRSDD